MSETADKIQYIKGVGPKRAELLAKLGIFAVPDLLRYYPRGWEDRRFPSRARESFTFPCAVFRGKVLSSGVVPTRFGTSLFRVILEAGDKTEVEALWFRRGVARYDPFASLKKSAVPGADLWVIGSADEQDLFAAARKISVEEAYPAGSPEAEIHTDRLTPVYPLTEGLSGKFLRETVWRALALAGRADDILPSKYIARRALPDINAALRSIHFPSSGQDLLAARKRLVYEEFLLLAAAWGIKKRQNTLADKKFSYEIKKTLLTPFRQGLGFDFTPAQKKVINEIFADMQGRRPMTRLLQGDVGSGKTVVALSALLLAAENGYQGAFMAPTEILAEQHFMTFKRMLSGLPVGFELLTSSVTKAARKKILDRLAAGELAFVVGTHALLEDDVKFRNLTLAVIDEQHRFGVRQRALLRQKASMADMLIMTATPIPRTLSLALYGDLDVSTIDSLPPGRKHITTLSTGEAAAFARVREEVARGRQAYIVHPVIDEGKNEELKAVKTEFESLGSGVFSGLRLAMLHGQMKAQEKSAVMERFLRRELDILVATPVIEVGIDVKNATVMVIRNVERFGLASLHQLRGRVGRGEHESYCLLVSGGGENARRRAEIMCSTSDGFKIGEYDMSLRGPGEILGTRQHGMFEFTIGDMVKDREALAWAIEDRDDILASDPNLSAPENALFRKTLLETYSRKWHLIDLA